MRHPDPSSGPDQTADHIASTQLPSPISASPHHQPTCPIEPTPSTSIEGAPGIPGYRIIAEIAKGGMGRVYAAIDLTLDREVAIKTLLPGANARRFVTESKITAMLPHPGIPPVYALGHVVDGTPYLAMKLIRGQTLAELLDGRSSVHDELPKYVQIFQQIAQAVGFAHGRGIIHRDLKPLNVMVGELGEVQVMDWGLAKEARSTEAEPRLDEWQRNDTNDLTIQGAVMGTPSYMAPEQARGERVDARADVFALGAILATILTGKPAFIARTTRETIEQAARGDVSQVMERLVNSSVDTELIALARKCLSPAATDRLMDARAVADAIAAYRAGVADRLRQAERERAEALVRDAEQRKRRRAIQVAASLLMVVLLLGASISGWFAWRSKQDARAAQAAEVLADREAQRAIEAEASMARALDEAEATLAESLLRPIGTTSGPPTLLELTALERLADHNSDGVRLRFLQAALADSDAAIRVTQRLAPVTRALVGFDARRKTMIERTLSECLADPARPRNVHLACVNLAGKLPCEGPELSDLALQRLLPATCLPNTLRTEMEIDGLRQGNIIYLQRGQLDQAMELLPQLVAPLSDIRAAHHADAVLAQTIDLIDPVNVRYQSQLMEALLVRLAPADAADRAERFAQLVLNCLPRHARQHGTLNGKGQFQSSADHSTHLQSLSRVVRWLTPQQSVTIGKAYLVSVRELGSPDSLSSLIHPSGQLGALFGRMPPDNGRALAEEVVEVVRSRLIEPSRRSRGQERLYLLRNLSGQLSPTTIAALWQPSLERLATVSATDLTRLAQDVLEVFPVLPAETAKIARELLVTRLVDALNERSLSVERVGLLVRFLQPLLNELAPDQSRTHAEQATRAIVALLRVAEQKADIVAYRNALAKIAPFISPTTADGLTPLPAGPRSGFNPRPLPPPSPSVQALTDVLLPCCTTEAILDRLATTSAGQRPMLLAILNQRFSETPSEQLPQLLALVVKKATILANSEQPQVWSRLVARMDAAALAALATTLADPGALAALLPVLAQLPRDAAAEIADRRLHSLIEEWAMPPRFGPRTVIRLEDLNNLVGHLNDDSVAAHTVRLAPAVPRANTASLPTMARRLECLLRRLPSSTAAEFREPVRTALLARLTAAGADQLALLDVLADLPWEPGSWQPAHQAVALKALSEAKLAKRLQLAATLARLAPKLEMNYREGLQQRLDQVFLEITTGNSPLDRLELSRLLAASPSPVTAAHHRLALDLADGLLQTWDDSPNEVLTEQTAQALTLLAPLLSTNRLEKVAVRALTALRHEQLLGDANEEVVALLKAVVRQMPGDESSRYRIATVRSLLALEMGRKIVPGGPGWRSMLPECTTADLHAILRSPTCLNEAELAVRKELTRR